MSLPLKRRIARAALLVAAAAPVIGMATSSASAVELPKAADLGGLSNTDAASGTADAVNSLTHHANGTVNDLGRPVVRKALPTVNRLAQTTTPVATKALTGAARTLDSTSRNTAKGGADLLPVAGLTGALPTKGVPGHGTVDGLPVI